MNPNSAQILTINGGSSSIKFEFYRAGEPPERRTYGKIDRIGLSGRNLTFNVPGEERQTRNLGAADHSIRGHPPDRLARKAARSRSDPWGRPSRGPRHAT